MMNENTELISVIIPVYNVEKYLDQCVKSVLDQSYRNLEIILVDDGSIDKSGEICDHYAESYKNVRVIHNNNQGPAASRRCGVENAKGSLVMFVDADDWIEKNILDVLSKEMKNSNADVVLCNFADIYNNGKIMKYQPFQEKAIECNSFAQSVHEIHGTRSISTGPWAKLYKKMLFKNVDFREHVTIGEDYTMLLQVLKNASKVRMIKDVLYNRRLHGGNISRSGYTMRHRLALDNYFMVREGLIASFPEYQTEILGYHMEYEMAVITAMCRNRVFDSEVIKKLKDDLKRHMGTVVWKCKIPIYMKVCAIMIAYSPSLFIAIFTVIHLLTGR